MSLKTKLYLMASLFGIATEGARKTPTKQFTVEGTDNHPVLKDSFSGHRYKKVYPDMNKKNTERKIKHRAMVQEFADQGICWTPFGLFRMNH
jgi:hypothetical protein